MTLDDLNAHIAILQKLEDARGVLASLQAAVLSSSKLDNMPHVGVTADRTAALAVKIVEQEKTVALYERQVKESEETVKAWIDTISDNRTNVILYLRFVCGYEWQAVAEIIGGKNTEAAVKSFVYRFFRSQAL